MIIFKWNITGLMIDRDAIDGKRDRVIEVSWELVGTDEATGVSAMRWGAEPVAHPVDRDMTPEQVLGWVQATFAPGIVNAMEETIVERIRKQVAETHYRVTAPWRVKDEPEAGGPDVVSAEPLRIT
jgi:hypothetical protein